MNLPRTEMRRENLLKDLQSKDKNLERKQENLKTEIGKLKEKAERLRATKVNFEKDIEEIQSQRDQIKKNLEELKLLDFSLRNQDLSKNGLDDLYRDYPNFAGKSKENIPSSLWTEYNL